MATGANTGALIVDTGLDTGRFMSDARQFRAAVLALRDTVSRVGREMAGAGDAYLRSLERQSKAVESLGAMNRRAGLDAVARGFDQVARGSQRAAASIARMAGGGALPFLMKLASGAQNAAAQMAKLAGRALEGGLRQLGALMGRATTAVGALLQKFGQLGAGLRMGLKNAMKYGFGIRTLYVLCNRLRTALGEAFSYLAAHDPMVRSSLAALTAGVNGLRNAMAASIAPILNAMAPALSSLIGLLTRATNAVGMFMAALTGQGYYTAAKAVGAVGGAAGRAGGAVKELKRQLASFDQLDILKENSSGGGGGGGAGGGGLFETVPIDSGIADFVRRLKELFAAGEYDEIGRVIAQGINGAFRRVQELIRWDSVGEIVSRWVDAFTGTFNGLVAHIDWREAGATLGEGMHTLGMTLNRLLAGIDFAAVGTAIGNGLNGLVERVNLDVLGEGLARLLTVKLTVVANAVSAFDWGAFAAKLAGGFGAFIDTLDEAISDIDWVRMARRMVDGMNRFIRDVDWRALGNFLGERLNGLFGVLRTAIAEFDWAGAAGALAAALNRLIERTDWRQIGGFFNDLWKRTLEAAISFVSGFDEVKFAAGVKQALRRVDWKGIAASAWELLKSAAEKLGGFVQALFGEEGETQRKLVARVKSEAGLVSERLATELDKNGVRFAGTAWESLGRALGEAMKGALEYLGKAVAEFDWQGLWTKIRAMLEAMDWEGIGRKLRSLLVDLLAELRGFIVELLAEGGPLGGGMLPGLLGLLLSGSKRGPGSAGEDLPAAMLLLGKALGLNTKSVGKNTEAQQESREGAEANRKGGEGLRTGTGDEAVDVDVRYNPVGQGASAYAGRPFDFLKALFTPGVDTKTRVELGKNGWTTISAFVGTAVKVLTTLGKNGWTSIGAFVGTAVKVLTTLGKNGWTSIGAFVGTAVKVLTTLGKNGWTSISAFVGTAVTVLASLTRKGNDTPSNLFGTQISVLASLGKKNRGDSSAGLFGTVFSTFASLFKANNNQSSGGLFGTAFDVFANLVQGWSGNPLSWLGINHLSTEVKVGLKVDSKNNKVKIVPEGTTGNLFKLTQSTKALGGIITAGGRSLSFAAGGFLRGSMARYFGNIPRYAAGTRRAHGTMFLAGEAGPEIVGHIGGRTEILNRSQLAQTMYAATENSMLAAMKRVEFRMPAMATGTVMPYEVSAQIARSSTDIQNTLDANNEDLIQTIISVAGQIVAAVQASGRNQQQNGTSGVNAQDIINEINRRTQMFSASPLAGV